MSTEAIQNVMDELQNMPESDQKLVVDFLRGLTRKQGANPIPTMRQGRNPELQMKKRRLVFTGQLDAPHVDWIRVVRDERDEAIARQTAGQSSGA